MKRTFKVVKPNSLILPKSGLLHRTPPRAVEQRQSNFDEKFDFDTVFGDVFYFPESYKKSVIKLSGPVLRNLREPFADAIYSDARTGRIGTSTLRDLNAIQDSQVSELQHCSELKVELSSGFSRNIVVATNECSLYAGKKVLLGISKDNELSWIRDWAQFYASVHGVDAVLLYDNSSTAYTSADVLEALCSVSGIDVGVVVEWPFPFGPQGGNWEGLDGVKWDSNYCQSMALDHARWRFLNEASGVVQCDIDELLVSKSGTIFDELDASPGLVYFRGHWIESLSSTSTDSVPAFQDFGWQDIDREPTTRKWVLDPSRASVASQWKVHSVVGFSGVDSSNTAQRHFRGISNSWKFNRNDARPFDPRIHVRDHLLDKTLEHVFGSSKRETFDDRRPYTELTVRGRIRSGAWSLRPAPIRVEFTELGLLECVFSIGESTFVVCVHFNHADMFISAKASASIAKLPLEDAFGPGVSSESSDSEVVWNLGDTTMRKRSKETASSNTLSLIQEKLSLVFGVQRQP